MPQTDSENVLTIIKAYAAPVIGGLLLALLSGQVNSAVGEMKDTRLQMQQVLMDAKVSSTRFEYMVERMKLLEDARKDAQTVHAQFESRLSSLEQREAIHDQFTQAHK